jgi:Na+/melibiose symporter-like transporter
MCAGAAWAVVVVCAVIVAFLLDGDMNQQWPTSAIVFGSIGSVATAIAVAGSFAVLAFLISPLRFTWPREEPDSD